MPRLPDLTRLPKYRHYKPKNLAVVRLIGKDHYLGAYGSPESWEKYHRLTLQWQRSGEVPAPCPDAEPAGDGLGVSVSELILAFLRHAQGYYRRADGTPTGEFENFRYALRPLKKLFGSTPARDFGPRALKEVRDAMAREGLCRNTVNFRVGKVVRVFKWGVENELVPPAVHHGLKAVAGLRKGRSGVRETGPVKPVPDAFVDAIRPHVSRQVWAMVELQRLTGMRPGEVTIMRTGDLDATGPVWTYTPERHKTEHHGRRREIPLGPKAQAVVRPWLSPDLDGYLFQPREADAEFRARKREDRKSPLTPSQRARKPKRDRRRAPGDHYDTRSYAHAVHRGCEKAGVPAWGPNRLRHNAATLLRRECGLDAARAVLGHSSPVVTEVYAERDRNLAVAAMARLG
jgi:integrase